MAARIKKAALKDSPAIEVEAADYNKKEHGPVICPDRRCGCDVQGVGPGTRTIHKEDGTSEQLPIAPYFRLPKNAASLLLGHDARCRFNIEATVTRLVAYSRQVRQFDKGCEPMLARKDSGLAEYRLHILMDALSMAGPERREKDTGRLIYPDDPVIATRYMRARRALRPYLRTVRAVNSLIARMNGDPSVADLVRLCFGSHTIAWKDFFYDIDDHGRLYSYLKENGQFRRIFDEDHDRPVAFAVRIRSDRPLYQDDFGRWVISCEGRLCQFPSGIRAFVNPVIYTRKKALADMMKAGSYFLVCAIPTITPLAAQASENSGSAKSAPVRYFRGQIRLHVNDRAQICGYTPQPENQ